MPGSPMALAGRVAWWAALLFTVLTGIAAIGAGIEAAAGGRWLLPTAVALTAFTAAVVMWTVAVLAGSTRH